MKNLKNILFTITIICLGLTSCSKDSIHEDGFNRTPTNGKGEVSRLETDEKRNVLLLYSAGYNSLTSYLEEDIEDLQQGWLPGEGRNQNILLIYSHFPVKQADYATPTQPTLTRVYKNKDGQIVRDTLVRYSEDTHSATAEQLHNVLSYVNKTFPAKSYGMIFSSHATGYLPAGFYTNPNGYIFNENKGMLHRAGIRRSQPVPYIEPEHDPSLPAVKSIGQDQVGTAGNYQSYEINLDEFAKAIPMQMEYILFDACLMGGVEVAYELKDKCRLVGFSQTEVLAEGFDYRSLTSHLIGSPEPNPQAVCEDYFNQYIIQSGVYQSATISMIDCSRMEPLASVCKEMFSKYRQQTAELRASSVQRYYRSDYHWFFDLYDIIARSGASSEELKQLQAALDECVVYKATTPGFMGSFKIITYSGLSMYLPNCGTYELNRYYRTLQWNKDTSLVE